MGRGIRARGSPHQPLPQAASRARIPAPRLLGTRRLSWHHAGTGMAPSPPLLFIFWAAKPLCSPQQALALLRGVFCVSLTDGIAAVRNWKGKPDLGRFRCNAAAHLFLKLPSPPPPLSASLFPSFQAQDPHEVRVA